MAENTKKWEEEARRYRLYIRLEKRLSQNTVASYMRDLRQFAHFIQKERALIRGGQQTFPRPIRAGKGPAHMPEDLGLEQGFGDSRTDHFHKGRVASG